jgi:transcriptional regulator of arginine metabolism
MRTDRHALITRIITSEAVHTQQELRERLREQGCDVTQATLSRDIRKLGLTKAVNEAGKSVYRLPSGNAVTYEAGLWDRYIRVLREGTISMDEAGNLLVIKTVSGMAMAVAAALDAMNLPEIIGSIAGDDTVMCAVKTPKACKVVHDKIKNVL